MTENRSSSSSSEALSLAPAVLDVLRGAARGESVADTAARRVTSPWTVKSQRRDAIRTTGARTLTQAVVIALKDRGEL